MLIEETHVVGDSDEHHLGHVDHHQDQNLVAADEERAVETRLNPLVVVVADEVVNGGVLLVHHCPADDDDADGDRAEGKVGVEQDFCLLLEKVLVVVEAIDVHGWDLLPVDEVVLPVED